MTPTLKKHFHISDILSVTHDRLFSTRHMDAIYDICNFLTQDTLFTHQLPRVYAECKAWLLTLHPQLGELPLLSDSDIATMKGCGRKDWWKPWVDAQVARFGETLEIEPIPQGIHEYKHPLVEAEELAPGRVIAIETEPE